jgi:hypothetical protein
MTLRFKYFLINLFFCFIGISSSVVELTELPKNNTVDKIISQPAEVTLMGDEVFIILNGNPNPTNSKDEIVTHVENFFAAEGLRLVHENKFEYLEALRKVSYFVIIEQCRVTINSQQPAASGCNKSINTATEESQYYYYLVDALTLDVVYFARINSLEPAGILAPFKESEKRIQMSSCVYYQTMSNSSYNKDILDKSNNEILTLSLEQLNVNYQNTQTLDPKKIKQFEQDKYIILLNAATASLQIQDFDSFDKSMNRIKELRKSELNKSSLIQNEDYEVILNSIKEQLVALNYIQSNRSKPDIPLNKFYFNPVLIAYTPIERLTMLNGYQYLYSLRKSDVSVSIKVDLKDLIGNNYRLSNQQRFKMSRFSCTDIGMRQLEINFIKEELYFPLNCYSTPSKNNINLSVDVNLTNKDSGYIESFKNIKYSDFSSTTISTLPYTIEEMIDRHIINTDFKKFILQNLVH